jgi:hypothetical protein
MIKKEGFSSKCVNVPENTISRWSASGRETIFIWEADIEQSQVSDIHRRITKTNRFQKRTQFRMKVNLKKEQCFQVISPLT